MAMHRAGPDVFEGVELRVSAAKNCGVRSREALPCFTITSAPSSLESSDWWVWSG